MAKVVDQQHSRMDNDEAMTFPKTPQRPSPNSSRKLHHTPRLFRNAVSSSHSTKISTLFQDAASSLQHEVNLPRDLITGIRTQRMPSSQTRFTRFGNTHCSNAALALRRGHECSKEKVAFSRPHCEQACNTLNSPPIHARPHTPARSNVMTRSSIITNSQNNLSLPLMAIDEAVTSTALNQESSVYFQGLQAREPISSGFTTPNNSGRLHSKTFNTTLSQNVGPWHVPRLLPAANESDSDDDEHSTHGVRLVLPYIHNQVQAAQYANIAAWLEQLSSVSSEDFDQAHLSHQIEVDSEGQQTTVLPEETALEGFFLHSDLESTDMDLPLSDEENMSPRLPSRLAPPPLPPPPSPQKSSLQTISDFESLTFQTTKLQRPPSSSKRSSHRLTHGACLSAPPKRKKTRVSEKLKTPSVIEMARPQDNTVHEDDLAAALATLSPSVERHRKGRGPKRERCASFWDNDILNPDRASCPTQQSPEAVGDDAKVLRSGKRVSGMPVQCHLTAQEEHIKGTKET